MYHVKIAEYARPFDDKKSEGKSVQKRASFFCASWKSVTGSVKDSLDNK